MIRPHFLLIVLGCLAIGCASQRKPLRSTNVKLGTWRASYNDFVGAKRDICQSEQQWLQDDLVTVNGLLSKWLEATEGTEDDFWPATKLEMLEEGTQILPPVIEAHANNLRELSRCSFSKSRAFPFIIKRGTELANDARARVESTPKLKAALDFRRDLQRWKFEQPARAADAATLCSPKPRLGDPELYYAIAGDDGVIQYLFCDGSLVKEAAAGEREFLPPVTATARDLRRVKKSEYLDAAAKFPKDGVDRPPTPPSEAEASLTSSAE